MNTFSDYVPTTLRPEPGKRTLTTKDLRKRLMDISALIKDTKECRARAEKWDASPTKLWTISAYDNRIADLMEQATAAAKALANAPIEVEVENPDAL